MNKNFIKLEDLTNEKLKEMIETLSRKINQFYSVIHSEVRENYSYFSSSVQNLQLRILEEDYHNYANDGNTQVPGKKYYVYWIVPLIMDENDEVDDDVNLYGITEGFLEKCIFFELEINERTEDGRLNSQFVSLYYSRPNESTSHTDSTSKGYHVCGNNIVKLDHENDNYKLGSIVNAKNAAILCDLLEVDLKRLARIKRIKNTPSLYRFCGKLCDTLD
jgi:hypothetical protein